MADVPSLPPVPPERSALPAFLAFEAQVREELAAADRAAGARVAEAEAEATRLRREGETRLRQVVLDAERSAQRAAEDEARDRVSEARVRVQQWVEQAEKGAQESLGAALDLLCGGED